MIESETICLTKFEIKRSRQWSHITQLSMPNEEDADTDDHAGFWLGKGTLHKNTKEQKNAHLDFVIAGLSQDVNYSSPNLGSII